MFAPEKSIIRKIFNNERENWDRLGEAAEFWGAERQTLEGHSGPVLSVSFSPDSQLLASASVDKTIKLWDPPTGELRQTLDRHSDVVEYVYFSPDSQLLASASNDKTIKLWDPTTGELCQTLEGHSEWVQSVSFSPDGQLLASASDDKTIKLWDPTTGELRQTLEGHSHWLRSKTNAEVSILENEWICLQGVRIVWLPPEYRLCCSALKGGILAISHMSGRVSFISQII
jgi:WD40 repeat protein